ncbi:MAG: contact-dependent growth inhibition system immunity protein [Cyclobacteriaceae bacterium]|nr:contact-dependent growth inhibition system immunity protein [Cyclobacteriaceae bacterium]
MSKPKNKHIKTKFENNWISKSLESLEKDIWGESEYDSYLVTTCHRLRKIQLKDFDIEDLRIMIGQNIGLKFLIPLAIDRLKENILAEGDFYAGDLLKTVLTSEVDYWRKDKENWKKTIDLFNDNIETLNDTDTSSIIRKEWFDAFSEFKKFNS